MRGAAWSLAALLAAVPAGAEPVRPQETAEAGVAADRTLLDRVMTEGRVERSLPAPSWFAYSNDLSMAIGRTLDRRVGGWFRWLRSQGQVLPRLAWGLAIPLALVSVLGLARVLRRPRRRPTLRSVPKPAEQPARIAQPEGDDGRAEIERLLRQGDVAAALGALWWWLAHSLTAGEVDAAWTTRELIERSGRPDLSGLGRTLDRMVYGPHRPPPAEVQLFVERVEAVLA